LLSLLLIGCSLAQLVAPTPVETHLLHFQSPLPVPPRVAYVLSNRGHGFRPPVTLTLVDLATWQTVRQVALPKSIARQFGRDQQGRLWVDYEYVDTKTLIRFGDRRVQVLAPDGRLLRTLRPCADSTGGLHFMLEEVYILCQERQEGGFSMQMATFQAQPLRFAAILPFEQPEHEFTVFESASNGQIAVMMAYDYSTHTYLTLVYDLHQRQIIAKFLLPEEFAVSDILPAADRFYLLNSRSFHRAAGNPQDVLVIHLSNPPTTMTLRTARRAPLLGALAGDELYTLHGPLSQKAWGQAAKYTLVRTNLKSGEHKNWPLTYYWNAQDMAVVDGKVVFALGNGLHQFDPTTGELTGMVRILDAREIIVVE